MDQLVYLDQSGLSALARDDSRESSSEFARILNRNHLKLAISFPHVCETAKAPIDILEKLTHFVDNLPWVSLRPLIFMMKTELQNEFYRFLKVEKRKVVSPVGRIFDEFETDNFGELVLFARSNAMAKGRNLQKLVNDHDARMKILMAINSSDLKKERHDALANFSSRELKDRHTAELPFELPKHSLDHKEFIKDFDWNKCPYFGSYTAFQSYRYKDRLRNPSGDLCDAEHAVLAAVGCDYVMLERNAVAILNQSKKDARYKAKIFFSVKDLMDEIINRTSERASGTKGSLIVVPER